MQYWLKCYPTVSTCSLSLVIPGHISSDEEMKTSFMEVLAMDVGFGRM